MKVIVENLAIEYDDIGSGKVILFLHGWKDNLKTFDDLLPFLSSKYRIIRIDLPGFGKSGKPSESWVLDDYVKFINEFIFKLNLKVDTFVGHSLGGRILIKGVSQGKLKSNKLILIASAGIAKRKTLKNYFLMFISKIGKFITYIPPFYFFKKQIRKTLYSFIGSDYFNAGSMKEIFLNIIREDLTHFLENIKIPTLLIWGEDDTETPLTDGNRFHKLIKNSVLKVFKNSGHFVHKEKSKEVSPLIQDFI